MPARSVRFETTPNPHALKCVLDRALPGGARSYRTPEPAPDDDLAKALFALPGVTGLLIFGEWLTVNKSPEAAWPDLKPAIERVLSQWP
jgi:hypothetical protein